MARHRRTRTAWLVTAINAAITLMIFALGVWAVQQGPQPDDGGKECRVIRGTALDCH